jgi:hypothetical protein
MNGFFVMKQNDNLIFWNGPGYESRNQSTQRIIQLANEKFNIPNFDVVRVSTEDVAREEGELKYSTMDNDYSKVIPCFTFDCWKEVQIPDYTQITQELSRLGDEAPETDLLGWRGANTHPNRQILFKFNDKNLYDVEEIVWNRENPSSLTCSNYMSLTDSVKKWRYIIDVEGVSFSARFKFFLWSKRLVFLQDRPFKEWFWPLLVPWKHYVPVSRDLSDLEEKLMYIKNNPKIEDEIRMNAFSFAKEHLTLDKALERWRDVLSTMS